MKIGAATKLLYFLTISENKFSFRFVEEFCSTKKLSFYVSLFLLYKTRRNRHANDIGSLFRVRLDRSKLRFRKNQNLKREKSFQICFWNRERKKPVRSPSVTDRSWFVRSSDDFDRVRNHECRIETDTELSDDFSFVSGILLLFQVFEKKL